MYKNLFNLAALAVMLWSCGQQKTQKTPPTDAAGSQMADVPALSDTPIDTMELAGKTYLIYTIDSTVFENFKVQPQDTSEAQALAKDSTVKRTGNSLQFKLQNGKIATLTDKDSDAENEGDFVHFSYVSNYPEINRKGIIAYYYESQDFLLLDTRTGDTLHIWTEPIFSPDKKHILCASMDLVAAFMPNGFQLYNIEKDSIRYMGETNLETWGPTETKWVDAKTILCRYISIDDEGTTQSTHVKLVMQ
ncbi:hypothetical protein SAMN05444266_101518 [Chitinophaga jiangningensis]|uniref:Uncharacterized protein n=2 Tax=Chitinophaga jiangningensis TaxID=1419482 RepID=A0A1M6W7Q8_9BACT|nr:hypothetical protein SAMN05444266_101518 [Chitinophaga jiangningensis]